MTPNKKEKWKNKGTERKILHLKTTYIDRTKTNEDVYRIANNFWNDEEKLDRKNVHVIPLSMMIKNRKCKLMGHLIRQNKRNPKDPMVQVTFEGKNIKPRTPAYRRVGRPKLQWTEETLAESWNRIKKKVFEIL